MDYDKEEILEDYRRLLADFWYVVQCWNSRNTAYPDEILQREEYYQAMADKYGLR